MLRSCPLLLAILCLLGSAGCSVNQGDINLGPKAAPERKVEAAPAPVVIHDPVLIFTYDHEGKPIASGYIAEVNPDGTVTMETKQTGEKLRFRIDPRGWLLIKPTSPIVEEKPGTTPAK